MAAWIGFIASVRFDDIVKAHTAGLLIKLQYRQQVLAIVEFTFQSTLLRLAVLSSSLRAIGFPSSGGGEKICADCCPHLRIAEFPDPPRVEEMDEPERHRNLH